MDLRLTIGMNNIKIELKHSLYRQVCNFLRHEMDPVYISFIEQKVLLNQIFSKHNELISIFSGLFA